MDKQGYLASLGTEDTVKLARFLGAVVVAIAHQTGQLPDAIANWVCGFEDGAFVDAMNALTHADSEKLETASIETVLKKPHLLILGDIGSGKSTLVKFLAGQSSAPILVIDPHATPTDWGKAEVVGAGRNYKAIGAELRKLVRLMELRYQARAKGQTNFQELIVVIDEFPSIVSALGKIATDCLKLLIREARKVGIKLFILSQGAEVKTLGIEGEGSLKASIALMSLGNFAIQRAKSTKDEAIREFISNAKRPAMLDDLPCDLPDLPHSLTVSLLPLPADYRALVEVEATNAEVTNYQGLADLQGSEVPALTGQNDDDPALARKCKLLTSEGFSNTWIVENILGCRGRNFQQGKDKLTRLLAM